MLNLKITVSADNADRWLAWTSAMTIWAKQLHVTEKHLHHNLIIPPSYHHPPREYFETHHNGIHREEEE